MEGVVLTRSRAVHHSNKEKGEEMGLYAGSEEIWWRETPMPFVPQ